MGTLLTLGAHAQEHLNVSVRVQIRHENKRKYAEAAAILRGNNVQSGSSSDSNFLSLEQ